MPDRHAIELPGRNRWGGLRRKCEFWHAAGRWRTTTRRKGKIGWTAWRHARKARERPVQIQAVLL